MTTGRGARERTYAISSAGSDVVGQAGAVTGVAHHDDSLDLVKSGGVDARGGGADVGTGIGATTDSVVHDLTALFIELETFIQNTQGNGTVTHLRISNKNDLSVGAASVQVVDGRGNGVGALSGRVTILDAAARRLTTAGRVGDSLGGGTGIGLEDEVDNDTGGTVTWRDRGLTSTEDVDGRA